MSTEDDHQLVVDLFDAIIDARLATLEAAIRRDLAVTGPENDDVLDAPPAPDADWQLISVEEILARERATLERWRDRVFSGRALTGVRLLASVTRADQGDAAASDA